MNLRLLPMLTAMFLLSPPALAHLDPYMGAPKSQCEGSSDTSIHDYGDGGGGFVVFMISDNSIPPCPYGDTTWDGHYEYGIGGGALLADDFGAQLCWFAYADHVPGAVITVFDTSLGLLGGDVAFSVYADTQNNLPVSGEFNCGDGLSDYGIDCVNSCAPGFPPGLDGSYQVYVSGTNGHIFA